MKTAAALAVLAVGITLLIISTMISAAPSQRFMKIEVCAASGRAYDDCVASTPRTSWDRAYDTLFH